MTMNHKTHEAYHAAEAAYKAAQDGVAANPDCFYAITYLAATKACWDIVRNAESPEDKEFNDTDAQLRGETKEPCHNCGGSGCWECDW